MNRDEEVAMWGEEPDEWEEDDDNEPICSECGRSTCGEGCGQCGADLCPMCFECNAGFCSKHPDSNYQPETEEDYHIAELQDKLRVAVEALRKCTDPRMLACGINRIAQNALEIIEAKED